MGNWNIYATDGNFKENTMKLNGTWWETLKETNWGNMNGKWRNMNGN